MTWNHYISSFSTFILPFSCVCISHNCSKYIIVIKRTINLTIFTSFSFRLPTVELWLNQCKMASDNTHRSYSVIPCFIFVEVSFVLQPKNNYIAAFIHLLLYSVHQLLCCPFLSKIALRCPFFLKLAGHFIKISVKCCLITGNCV